MLKMFHYSTPIQVKESYDKAQLAINFANILAMNFQCVIIARPIGRAILLLRFFRIIFHYSYYSSGRLLKPFPYVQINQITHATSGIGWGVGKRIHFFVKVIVQGQGHREGFSKKVKPSVGIRDRELQS